ncbi:MAG: hypothetical protein KAQ94_01505 [Arcobacteraceae bacterium]|nr:hypothetical protein [Arcobacteraceae bacterium]
MAILFIRFGWFILGAFFGAWVMFDPDRALVISSSINTGWSSLSSFVTGILNSMGF